MGPAAFFLAGDDAGVAGVAVAGVAAAVAGGRPGRFLDGIEALAFAMSD